MQGLQEEECEEEPGTKIHAARIHAIRAPGVLRGGAEKLSI